jgi:hypothetical protein
MKTEKDLTSEASFLEAKKGTQLMVDIDDLFRQIEGESDEETRKTIEDELRGKLKQYHQILGKKGKEEIEEYYKRLKKLKEPSNPDF